MPPRTNIWGGSFEIIQVPETQTVMEDADYDRAAYHDHKSPALEEEVKQSWLLRPDIERGRRKTSKFKINGMMVRTLAVLGLLALLIIIIIIVVTSHRRRHHPIPGPDNYTVVLPQALMFFNAQRSGRLPKHNNVSWRGNSCLNDGRKTFINSLVGGYYDAGGAIKFSFSTSFAMTLLSWSVLEYRTKYEAIGELNHVKNIIKWGTDYLLNTFNSTADSITVIASQVGGGDPSSRQTNPHDLSCWMRPEHLSNNDPRPVYTCDDNCPALAAEMAGSLAAASIAFKDDQKYSQKLVHGAQILFKFATKGQGESYSGGPDPPSVYYNSTGFWDDFVWAGAWLYYATGRSSYLRLVTTPSLSKRADAFWGRPHRDVLSWNSKYVGAQLLLTRMRLFLSYGYPAEEMLRTYQNQLDETVCSYLPYLSSFNRTRGGLILLNNGGPRPLQYGVNAAFVTTLYMDYLEASDIPGLFCRLKFYPRRSFRGFAKTQMDYVLGRNPQNMSYVVGFGSRFPHHVLHRGASIPKNNTRYCCRGGLKWRNSVKPNPNVIVGAMVGGPNKDDGFQDRRFNYNSTEPTLVGNAGLVAALVALSGEKTGQIDRNTIFYAVPPPSTFRPTPAAI